MASHVMNIHKNKIVEEDKKREKHYIYKLPPHTTERYKINLYNPQLISFGPYHHQNLRLKYLDFEPYKESAADRLLDRCGISMDDCVELMLQKGVAVDWMDAYDCLGSEWQSNPVRFVEMMIRDGSFVLEILQYWCYMDPLPELSYEYPDYHRVFSGHGSLHVIPDIRRDMLMLENQLPLSLLQELLYMSVQENPELLRKIEQSDYLLKLCAQFCFVRTDLEGIFSKHLAELKPCKHLLDVWRRLLILGDNATTHGHILPSGKDMTNFWPIPSAVRLYEAGIIFRPNRTDCINDVVLKPGPLAVLAIPKLEVDHATESMMLNILAFERHHARTNNVFTSCVYFLSCILATEKDVTFLSDLKIIKHTLGSDVAVARLFNTLSDDITSYPCRRIHDEHMKVVHLCQRPLMRFRGYLIATYFTDPWTPILRLAWFAIFAVTLTQTIYTAAQYYKS